jgi:SAM-dependent MidA family methyltransferase
MIVDVMKINSSFNLPVPAEAELKRSDLLQQVLCQKISSEPALTDSGLRFDHFMETCLYAPGLGYYSGPGAKFGESGDFVTAPMLTPLFGACLGRQCQEWLSQLNAIADEDSPCEGILEFGAGNGLLASQILNELARVGANVKYTIIELSANLVERQRATIAALAPTLLPNVRWQQHWPTDFSGVMLGNELIDAMPVRLFHFDQNSQLFERYVAINPSEGPPFVWRQANADSAFSANVKSVLSRAGWGDQLPANFTSELPEQAMGWMKSAAGCLKKGVILLLDYGFSAAEFYHPQRSEGTLNCHYRHHSHSDPFYLPGLQDITAHVDFSHLTDTAFDVGLALLGYTNQATFLLNLGLLDRLQAMVDDPHYPRYSQAVGRLISEAEMGELFKVAAYAKLPATVGEFTSLGFSRGDKSHKL